MAHVLTLAAAKAKAPLRRRDVEEARRSLDQIGAVSDDAVWLSPDEACDLPFSGDPAAALASARSALAGKPVDVNVLEVEGRRKKLLVADMDSTMIEQECIDELAAAAGFGKAVSAITERAMRGEITFEPALVERVRLLAGLPVSAVDALLAERITLMPGGKLLVATMRSHGAYTVLVSGGFSDFVAPIAARLGFDEHRANRLIEDGGRFTGHVAEPILGRQAKQDAVADLTVRLSLQPRDSLAVGDGANDIAMVQQAGLGVAFHAKPALRAAAAAVVDHADLTALLFLQGYRRDEFVG